MHKPEKGMYNFKLTAGEGRVNVLHAVFLLSQAPSSQKRARSTMSL